MRIGHYVIGLGTPFDQPSEGKGLLTARIQNFGSAPDVAPVAPATSTGHLTTPNESILYFNFWPDPAIMYSNTNIYPKAYNPYSATSPVPAPLPPVAGATYDPRAMILLDCLTTNDRYSDFTVTIGNGNPDITKIRVLEKLNVNTASGDVLRALPAINALGGNADMAVANILTYRSGIATKYNGVSPSGALSASLPAPSNGFHSMAEFLIPLAAINNNTTTMYDRDTTWARLFNLCTVRSDTFVVYGYLEAVRPNPGYTATFNNQSDWYQPTTDDPTNTTARLLRVAKRRWVAIVDRSFSDYSRYTNVVPKGTTAPVNLPYANDSYVLPKIVAIRNLPQ